MEARRIGELLGEGSLKHLRAGAERNDELSRAIRESIPDWLGFEDISYDMLSRDALRLEAPHASTRMLRTILPTLKRDLRRFGVRSVTIEVRRERTDT